MPGTERQTFTIIYHMALGLEKRFPGNNSVFSYGTRLCEETGELIEILNKIHDEGLTPERRHHLVKEAEDVLQIIQGVLGIYELNSQLPLQLEAFLFSEIITPTKNDIIHLAIFAGKLADTINHMESQGIKSVKHGKHPEARLIESASNLTGLIARFLQAHDVIDDFKTQIQKDYAYLLEAGYILTAS
jgi:hypothetical protein